MSGAPGPEEAVFEDPEAALEAALQLSPQAKGKPIEELSTHEANDMTCAICLDQIPVAELCAIKGCDHVYCGEQPSFVCRHSKAFNSLLCLVQADDTWETHQHAPSGGGVERG